MLIVEYLILGASIMLTVIWHQTIRRNTRIQQKREKSKELQAFLMATSLFLVIFFHVSPYHLLWMLPFTFVIGLLSIVTPLRFLWLISSNYFMVFHVGAYSNGRKLYLNGEYEKAVQAFRTELR